AMFVLTIVNNTTMTKIFTFKPAVYLGKISYGIYVWHYFVMILAAGLLHPITGGHQKFIGNFWAELAMYTFYLILLVIVAQLSYRFFESYFIRLKDKT